MMNCTILQRTGFCYISAVTLLYELFNTSNDSNTLNALESLRNGNRESFSLSRPNRLLCIYSSSGSQSEPDRHEQVRAEALLLLYAKNIFVLRYCNSHIYVLQYKVFRFPGPISYYAFTLQSLHLKHHTQPE